MSIDPATVKIAASAISSTIGFLTKIAKPKVKEQLTKWKTFQNAEQLRLQIRQIGNISTIASKSTSTIDDIYFPAKIRVAKNATKLITHTSELFSKETRIALILGTAGQGKSVFLRYLCLSDLEIEGKIPLFVELRRIDKEKNLTSLLHEHLKNLGIGEDDPADILKFLLESGKSRVFLDGYDEISREYSIRTKNEISRLLQAYKEVDIAITSRPGAISQHLSDSFNISQHEIAPISSSDHGAFFQKIGVVEETKTRLISAIDRSKAEIKNLLSTPFMLTLLFITCGAQQDLPDTLPEFYDSLFNVLSSTHDGKKPGYTRQKATNLSNAELERLFCAFSFTSKTLFKKNSLTHRQFEESFQRALKISDTKCTLEGFRTEITETVCLMINDGLDTAFIHKSIQEYYAARFIHKIEDKSYAVKILTEIEKTGIFEWMNEWQFLEDFRDRTYENSIGIPHAKRLIEEISLASKKNTASWIKLKRLIQKLKISVGRYQENKQIVTVSYPSFIETVNHNRYSTELTSELTIGLFKSLAKSHRMPSIPDKIEVIQLSKLADQDPGIKKALMFAAQRYCEVLNKKQQAMSDRQNRQNMGLLSLIS